MRGEPAQRSPRGRSLYVPIRFGDAILGAAAVASAGGEGYTPGDLTLLEDWAALVAARINGLELAAQKTALEALVGTDGLTGLRNRRGLDAELESIWRAARRTGESVAIVMADVDFFKAYNDRYGHLAGDVCLRRIAQTIAAGLRPGDVAARFGGEEFVAVLRDADLERAIAIAERLRESIVALQIPHAGSTLDHVSASFGVAAAAPRGGHDSAGILAAADAILYVAKGAGRNRVAAEGYAAQPAPAAPRQGGEHNLPAIGSSFCGRDDDIAAVLAELARSRLVSLIAFGGVGKTRLSIEVAGRCRGSFRNGVWFVDLAGSADPELLPERVAAAIGLPDIPGSRSVDGVAALLADRELLIVLDNCEHIVAACARFCAAVLAAAPAVRILATSRERLGLPSECAIALLPLGLPPPDAVLSAADVARYPALKLFVDRAGAIAPLALTDAGVATIADICRRLDGLALAIELAAARLRMLTLDELRARLDRQLRVVGRAGGTGSARQRTLRGLIDWSFELLDERERRVFARLGIFSGPFTLELAGAVCADDGQDVLDVLEELVDKSLVSIDAPAADARAFRLYESIREYACERLEETGELDALRHRLIARVCAHGRTIAAARSTAGWRRAMLPLIAAVSDVRAVAEATIVDGRDPLAGAALAADLGEFWQVCGRAHEGRTWLERALAMPGLPAGLRAAVLNSYLWQQPLFGDAWENAALAAEALELATRCGDDEQISAALFHVGDAAFDLGDFGRAQAYGLRALERFVVAGDLYGEAYAANCIGAAADLLPADPASGNPGGGAAWYERSIAICRRIERPGFAARVQGNVAESEVFGGRVAAGIALANEALAEVKRENDRPAIGWLSCNLGLFYQFSGEFDIAVAMLLDALRVVIEIRDEWLIASCCDNLAGIALHGGRPDCAARFLGCAQAIFTRIELARQAPFAAIVDELRERAQAALGRADFEVNERLGRALTRDEICREAWTLSA